MEKFDGIFRVNDSEEFYPSLTVEQFKKSKLYNGQDTERFFWLRNKQQKILNNSFIIGVLFRNNTISQLQLYCINDKIDTEEKRKKFNDSFVRNIAPEETYSWGTIQSLVDERENISLILVDYK